MGACDSIIVHLFERFGSWFHWGRKDICFRKIRSAACRVCNMDFLDTNRRYNCQTCGTVICGKCLQGYESVITATVTGMEVDNKAGVCVKSCKVCVNDDFHAGNEKMCSRKVHPSASLMESLDPPLLLMTSGRHGGDWTEQKTPKDHFSDIIDACENCSSPQTSSSAASLSGHPSPVSVFQSSSRSDEKESENSGKYSFSPLSEYYQSSRDVDSSRFSARLNIYNSKSVGSSPLDSSSRNSFASYGVGSVQHDQGRSLEFDTNGPSDQEIGTVLEKPDTRINFSENTDDASTDMCFFHESCEERPLDFENNGMIWFPPSAEDEQSEAESNYFCYDDEDDEIGESGGLFSSSSSLQDSFLSKEKHIEDEPTRTVVRGHFMALVAQLFRGDGIDDPDEWLTIITELAWQAANYVKPDTSGGGSMDPMDYVKVKCIATGNPSDSTLVKGIVCTKNIKHKRMNSQYTKPRLLILGGALEYQRLSNQLASFDTLLQQEIDHLKMIVSTIEAHRPNVLLVEKTVSSYAQDYLLAKEISLVLNVKRPLLERIARCSGAVITPSLDKIANTRLGQCELFHVEKIIEEHETAKASRRPSKTLMYFEGCPRRLGCTVVLKGACREELKKMKHVFQYSVFAAYHLSLETSFLADEGASLPEMTLRPSMSVPASLCSDRVVSVNSGLAPLDFPLPDGGSLGLSSEVIVDSRALNDQHASCKEDLLSIVGQKLCLKDYKTNLFSTAASKDLRHEQEIFNEDEQLEEKHVSANPVSSNETEMPSEYFSSADTNQSILVSFSSRCVVKGTVCERSRLFRIKYYGSFDKPLGKYLCEDLFAQEAFCRSCDERIEAHIQCYTHQQGSLTISVKRLPNVKLPGEQDGKIWMWHRCLKCAHVSGIPPATKRVNMSDAAWGLSFGKFLELSFSNHTTANRLAPCGHSLQRDCLRYYGSGSMVAFFRYSPIEILSVHLPTPILEFNANPLQEWIKKEATELIRKSDTLYSEIYNLLHSIVESYTCSEIVSDMNDLSNYLLELQDLVKQEKNQYSDALQTTVDILELNRCRRSLLIDAQVWDCRLCALDSSLRSTVSPPQERSVELKDLKNGASDKVDYAVEDVGSPTSGPSQCLVEFRVEGQNELTASREGLDTEELTSSSYDSEARQTEENSVGNSTEKGLLSFLSNLSDRIDSAWTGTVQSKADGYTSGAGSQAKQKSDHSFKRMVPQRVFSFDSAKRARERTKKGFTPSSLYLSTLKSFHASGEYGNMVRDPVADLPRSHSQVWLSETEIAKPNPLMIYSGAYLADGARLLLPETGSRNVVVAVYDNEPSSAIAYALSSKEHGDWISGKVCDYNGTLCVANSNREGTMISGNAAYQSQGSMELGYVNMVGSRAEDSSISSLFVNSKKSPHLRITFEDESLICGGKMKFSVTSYFAKQFDSLRKECCPSEDDFVRSLSRCGKWSAQGGKSNVYFAKSLDQRFIIKQITKTELESFEEFASEYFKYLSESLSSGPTCLAKVLGIYQVTAQNLKGGKESKMDLIVMENLFYNRNISKIYDLKGSARSRYNADPNGTNNVLLDMNLLETLRTNPIFINSNAKRKLERAVWNDTSFLASVDVMDYSLLVGVDNERKELVIGIIDFMRQYTWDKHLETWVKASGILGGPKNASPTIISPKQYKRRFRKAMTTYFHTVPDQWPS